jgi:hypothetical protein
MTRRTRLLVPLLAALALGTACDRQKTCSSDMTLCGGTCAKLDTDPANCGACGYACGAGESCYGACFCPFNTTCGGACVDLASDPGEIALGQRGGKRSQKCGLFRGFRGR